MIALVQRVNRADVKVSSIPDVLTGRGLLVLLGVRNGDSEHDASQLASKCASLRIFADGNGKMNLSVVDAGGETLVVSQFTLCADTRKGNRPSFINAAPPEEARRLYEFFVECMRKILGDDRVKTGTFGADMRVGLENDGPVTIILTSGADRIELD